MKDANNFWGSLVVEESEFSLLIHQPVSAFYAMAHQSTFPRVHTGALQQFVLRVFTEAPYVYHIPVSRLFLSHECLLDGGPTVVASFEFPKFAIFDVGETF